MKNLLVVMGVSVLLMAATPLVQAADPVGVGFFRAVDDLPLMPGLTEQADEAVVFDQPDGRIVEVTATGTAAVTGASVTAFYDETLPQLGWVRDGSGGYVRDRERLTIQYGTQTGGPLRVKFAIQPLG
ncbi:MAG: hypothetical protein KKA05_08260 [Alphaproteobacteria bacterium]|nr:hypothetical protein [Alphaproteobacteria bacterium]MBU0859449.1 hypothetical protein [Alphaproteobacteria bacterium]